MKIEIETLRYLNVIAENMQDKIALYIWLKEAEGQDIESHIEIHYKKENGQTGTCGIEKMKLDLYDAEDKDKIAAEEIKYIQIYSYSY